MRRRHAILAMMFSRPYFYNDLFSNPYLYRSQDAALAQKQAQARARAPAQQRADQRARRAVYLPHEEDSSDDEDSYPYAWLSSRDRLYLEARQKQQQEERRRIEEEVLRKQMIEARREEQVKRERERMQQQSRSRTRSPKPLSKPTKPRSPSPPTVPRSPSPTAETTPVTSQSRSSTPQYSDLHHEAATKIQASYRIHRSLRTIEDLERQFDELRSSLTLPTVLDFQGPDNIIHVTIPDPTLSSTLSSTLDIATPKLSYTANNYAVHAHVEGLNRLLMKLDSVESWGDSRVRKSRKAVVWRIDAQASEVEAYWKRAWIAYDERTSAVSIPASSGSDDVYMNEETKAQVEVQPEQDQPAEMEAAPVAKETEGEKAEEKAEESEVQMMIVDELEDVTPLSTHPIDSSTVAVEHRSDDDDHLDTVPELCHVDSSESSDSELEFEGADAAEPESAMMVVMEPSDLDSSSEDHPSLLGNGTINSVKMVTEHTKEMDVINVDPSLGEFVVV